VELCVASLVFLDFFGQNTVLQLDMMAKICVYVQQTYWGGGDVLDVIDVLFDPCLN
jgi:hypothetical protein